MRAVRLLTGDIRRDDSARRRHIGMHGPLQMLAQTARLSRQRHASAEIPCAAE